MSQVDTRSFVYALEPVRRRAQHAVETAMAALAARRRDATESLKVLQQCTELHEAWARKVTPAHAGVIDPWRAMAATSEGLRLNEARLAAKVQLDRHDEAVRFAQAALTAAQAASEGLEAHHAQALDAFSVEMARRQQAAVDQDWTAREHVLRSSAAANEQEGHGA